MQGLVYAWNPDPRHPLGGRVSSALVPLENLDPAGVGGLSGRFARVRNAGVLAGAAVGNAHPDSKGHFVFDPGRGGERIDKTPHPGREACARYLEASRFGETNTYFHLDRIASYVDGLLRELGARSLPPVAAVVNAHPGTTVKHGVCDGIRRGDRCRPFQGGHYRLPGPRVKVREHDPVSPQGEIHLGPGWELLEHGALAEKTGARYRHNASHNAGILYHEYGHHITRHTADFQGNVGRPADFQENRKTSLDEGICDYWAATMLGSPHIWALHRRHEARVLHRRSLASSRTMADFDAGVEADPHANGTIWAAALWNLRVRMGQPRATDLLLVKALLLWRDRHAAEYARFFEKLRHSPGSYRDALGLLLVADEALCGARHRAVILESFGARAIAPVETPASFAAAAARAQSL